MKRLRNISIVLLFFSAFAGLVRGYRMTGLKPVVFPYPEETIKITVFSNYNLFGWIIFLLLGVFSIITLICIYYRTRSYSYLIITEGIFLCFFTLTHILYNGFSFIHLVFLPFCIAMITLGIMQTPKEFDED
jgi:presenilin-like A22 family membrane protease